MLGNALKLAAIAAVLFVGYKGLEVYSALKFADHLNACTSSQQLCQLATRQASAAEIGTAMRETFACVKQKQSWFEPLFFPINKQLSDPPAGSVDYRQLDGLCKR
ncbi:MULTISPECIES: hypothetical protein [unclassified Rhizobacter]|uniref:hypothetical protein n=1 Tax=unclassified Rhizobacter TaxID=2640088 RepID=UPI0006F3C0EE|nr:MULTISPECIES: hypothetical protein [unclassified Rhizobacter]KQU71280.1 hypothetical protein ASC88_05845 [Rhizobacter sp. Root29]KQV97035.1 hypothetical protein ASC98_12935 [Rhizobacter sp. Root1238]KRB24107.1 hypothetical protein ASE08_18835 [Rhizobacter sp. Root16D2]